jgi:hypothetical protein
MTGTGRRFTTSANCPHHTAVQLIDTSIVRAHQHGAFKAGNREQLVGRPRGGLTSKVHAVVDPKKLPVRVVLTTGAVRANRLVFTLLPGLK